MRREHINPDGIFKHPAFTSIVTVENPTKFHFIAGRCSADDQYNVIGAGDLLTQYREVMRQLSYGLEVIGATWSDVVFRRIFTLDVDACLEAGNDAEVTSYYGDAPMPPSTLIGVTRLSNPEFLIEIDLMVITG